MSSASAVWDTFEPTNFQALKECTFHCCTTAGMLIIPLVPLARSLGARFALPKLIRTVRLSYAIQFASPYFIMPKKGGGVRPIQDPRVFHVSILPRHRPFLWFAFDGRAWQYKVLPSGLSLSPCVFTKVTLAPLHEVGIRILNLDDWLIMAHFQLGLWVNWEKSKLSNMQRISFLGMKYDNASHQRAFPISAELPEFLQRQECGISETFSEAPGAYGIHSYSYAARIASFKTTSALVTLPRWAWCHGTWAGSLGALVRSSIALAHQLPRVAGSATSLAAVPPAVAWRARVGLHGQHCVRFVHQPAGLSTITSHVTTQPRLESLCTVHILGELNRAANTHQGSLLSLNNDDSIPNRSS
ncbi:hypothetical protein H4Q32_006786 [Labeo rohita]|uniref:Uncharacterized protein n=1 Tax=Labeo rohita TaxID=84645 RepID=A0ABQ8MEB1_LABRO|nr:hypothetical protein H4Q32_006786 [Labeo rohita]